MAWMTFTLLVGATLVVSCHALKCYQCHSWYMQHNHEKHCTDEQLNLTSLETCNTAKGYCYKIKYPCTNKKHKGDYFALDIKTFPVVHCSVCPDFSVFFKL